MQGKVKFFNVVRGYGFIQVPDHEDVFVHVTQIMDGYASLVAEQLVSFQLSVNRRNGKAIAVDVRPLEPIISPRMVGPREDAERAWRSSMAKGY